MSCSCIKLTNKESHLHLKILFVGLDLEREIRNHRRYHFFSNRCECDTHFNTALYPHSTKYDRSTVGRKKKKEMLKYKFVSLAKNIL